MKPLRGKVAVVTGASSGIGAATASALAELGAVVVVGARRVDRLSRLCERARARGNMAEWIALDIRSASRCEEFIEEVLRRHRGIDILVNNAGLAPGFESAANSTEADRCEIMETNVLGLMRMTQLCLKSLVVSGGDIVHVGSIARHEPYENASAYCASKAAVAAFVESLRRELLGSGVRQILIEPGMTQTEFNCVRFRGDRARAKESYQRIPPLRPRDVAETIAFALTRPGHVCVQSIVLTPTDQASVSQLAPSRRAQRRAPELATALGDRKQFA